MVRDQADWKDDLDGRINTTTETEESKQFLDEFERELDYKAIEIELDKSEKSRGRRPEGDDVNKWFTFVYGRR